MKTIDICASAALIALIALVAFAIQTFDKRLDTLEAINTPIYPQVLTVLVGVDCLGSDAEHGVVVGLSEDEFTKCASIQAHDLALMP